MDGRVGPAQSSRWRRWILLPAVWAGLVAVAGAARAPEPSMRIHLEAMGYQTLLPGFLLGGGSMMTVHFVDRSHLLVTFTLRRLLVREPDAPNDHDRTIGAFLLEVPSGKVVAHTEWHVHDLEQYLWGLGHGRFLLRIRNQMTVIAPMDASNGDDAFRQRGLLNLDRPIVAVIVSAERDLLTVETADPPGEPDPSGAAPARNPAPIQINFYRMAEMGERLTVSFAGILRARGPLALPVTAAGYLDIVEDGKNRFGFNYYGHAGNMSQLAGIESTCFPRPTFVSASEFVAIGCRGNEDKKEIEAFNLKGTAVWQQGFYEQYVAPIFAFAPASGRFALGRTLLTASASSGIPLTPEQVAGQEVRVYQTYSGKQIFRIDCSPVQAVGQNFDLSPDGTELAVYRETLKRVPAIRDAEAYTVHDTAVEVYALPELTKEDDAAVQAARGMTPPANDALIQFGVKPVMSPAPSSDTPVDVPPVAAPVPAELGEGAAVSGNSSVGAGTPDPSPGPSHTQGDPPADGPRKPPTLYGPGETSPKPQ